MNLKAEKQQDGTWEVHGMKPWRDTFARFCENVKNKVPFKFARFGDGEFNCMMGKIGANCDGHDYSPELGFDLIRAASWCTTDFDIVAGIQPLSLSQPKYGGWRTYFPAVDTDFVNADVFHNASITGDLFDFTHILNFRQDKLVLVGASHLLNLSLFEADYQVLISSKNCYQDLSKVMFEIESFDKGQDVVFILCASMMSEVIIKRMRHSKNTFIDLGSVLDPYAGVKSRRYHHTLSI